MRAIPLARTYVLATRRALIPPSCAIRRFHITRLLNTPKKEKNAEQIDPAPPPPRKKGRPKKLKTEEIPAESTSAVEEVKTAPPVKPAKPRKPPKIADITRLIPPHLLQPAPPRPLRPYQEECVEACLTAISEGKRRLGISLATGAGKTVIFTNLIGKIKLEDSKRYQTLILVHRRELVEQAARHCVEVYPDKVLIPNTRGIPCYFLFAMLMVDCGN